MHLRKMARVYHRHRTAVLESDQGGRPTLSITTLIASNRHRAMTVCRNGAGSFVPLWGIPIWYRYAPRRVERAAHGVVVEQTPWSDGKRPVTCAMMGFLARWARRLSWRGTAQVFQTSWESVYSRWNGSYNRAWPTADYRGWKRWAWTGFIGATGCGRTTS